MPLPAPILDDRSYVQLRDELLRRIPVYAPEWTDHNPSDPGIALLELMAFLGENLLFRFNQIPEATRLAFLDLLGLEPRPAVAARSIVSLTTPTPPATEPPVVDIGTELLAGKLPFETEDEAAVLPVELRAVARQRQVEETLTTDQVDEVNRVLAARGGLESDEQAAYFSTETVPIDPIEPGAEPVDFATTVDDMIWIAVLVPPKPAPDDLIRAERRLQIAGSLLNVGVVLDEEMADAVKLCSGTGDTDTGPSLQWQISTGRLSPSGVPEYRPLDVDGDLTAGLTHDGIVRLGLPASPDDMGVFSPSDPDLGGSGDLPPELSDEEEADRVIFWVRAFRPEADQPFGRVRWIGANAARVTQQAKAGPELLGTGTGDANQEYQLVHAPVIAGSVVLEVEEASGWTAWTEVADFDASSEDDRHYVVDPAAGTVQFGGATGRPPQIGERVRVREYRYGGGAGGNVAAAAIDKVHEMSKIKVANPLPASGGAAAETVAAALDRIPAELRRRDRAVAAEDFQSLASELPGVGRTEVMPRFHPGTKSFEVPGIVSVVVWPERDPKHPDAPQPGRALVDAVCAHLDERRLVTTELYVVKPTYRTIAVSVGLEVAPGFGALAVRRWVELVIRQYLAPLPPYGPEGMGWPLGRRVHGPELEAAALQVEGVEYLQDLVVARLSADGESWVSGTVNLKPWEVPELAEITVIEGTPLEPGKAVAPPDTGLVAVPLPVPPPEEC